MTYDYPPEVRTLRLSARWAYAELHRSPDGCLTTGELCQRLACDPSTVRRAVADLEAVGVAERFVPSNDARTTRVRLL